MARKLRFIPAAPSPTLVFVTCRTIQGRYLFRPGPQFNDLFLGILGHVQQLYQMPLCGVCVLYAKEEAVVFSPIPCWAHLPPKLYRRRISSLVNAVAATAVQARNQTGRPIEDLGSILTRDPQFRPTKLARSPAPLVHAATQKARKAFYEMYAWFVAAFRAAAECLKRGDLKAPFPSGSFPPGLPFVAG